LNNIVPADHLRGRYLFRNYSRCLVTDQLTLDSNTLGFRVVVDTALKQARIGYTGMDGVPTQKCNGVVREFEASGHTVLLAGTGTLNRGVTINGANHVITLNTGWSPETTLQAEDRCHRRVQTKPVHVHYILNANTTEEQMWELLNQKAAAQRAVFDKEALYKSVEEVMSEAVSTQMQVAKAVTENEREAFSVQPSVVRVQLVTILDAQLTTRSHPQTCRFRPKVIRRRGTTRAKWPFQKLGAQGKQTRKRKPVILPEQQLSLFWMLAATD